MNGRDFFYFENAVSAAPLAFRASGVAEVTHTGVTDPSMRKFMLRT